MSLRNPASDLVDFLTSKTAGGVVLTRATNLFVGGLRSADEAPSPAVFVQNTGGPEPVPYLGGAREAWQRPTVQVLVRGPVDDTATAESVARGVYELLQMATISGYVAILSRASAPEPLGPDDDLRDILTMNFECQYKSAMP